MFAYVSLFVCEMIKSVWQLLSWTISSIMAEHLKGPNDISAYRIQNPLSPPPPPSLIILNSERVTETTYYRPLILR